MKKINPFIYKDFKLLPNTAKRSITLMSVGEPIYLMLYNKNNLVITCGYGTYCGEDKPKYLNVYDNVYIAAHTGLSYHCVKLKHKDMFVYSCESMFVRCDSSLEAFLKNKDQRYYDIEDYRRVTGKMISELNTVVMTK